MLRDGRCVPVGVRLGMERYAEEFGRFSPEEWVLIVECRRRWKSDTSGFIIVKWKNRLEGSGRVIQIGLIIVLF